MNKNVDRLTILSRSDYNRELLMYGLVLAERGKLGMLNDAIEAEHGMSNGESRYTTEISPNFRKVISGWVEEVKALHYAVEILRTPSEETLPKELTEQALPYMGRIAEAVNNCLYYPLKQYCPEAPYGDIKDPLCKIYDKLENAAAAAGQSFPFPDDRARYARGFINADSVGVAAYRG